MDIFTEEIEVREIKIEDIIKSNDKTLIIIKGEDVGKRNEGESNLVKEITAIDEHNLGSGVAARINNVPQSSASKYGDGKDIEDDETRARVLKNKFNIADTATTKLMETLGLFDPSAMNKQTDIVRAAAQLAGVVEKLSSKDKNGGNEIHLHLYSPKQKNIDKYPVIDV